MFGCKDKQKKRQPNGEDLSCGKDGEIKQHALTN